MNVADQDDESASSQEASSDRGQDHEVDVEGLADDPDPLEDQDTGGSAQDDDDDDQHQDDQPDSADLVAEVTTDLANVLSVTADRLRPLTLGRGWSDKKPGPKGKAKAKRKPTAKFQPRNRSGQFQPKDRSGKGNSERSFDKSSGSGFRRDQDSSRSQKYKSPPAHDSLATFPIYPDSEIAQPVLPESSYHWCFVVEFDISASEPSECKSCAKSSPDLFQCVYCGAPQLCSDCLSSKKTSMFRRSRFTSTSSSNPPFNYVNPRSMRIF